MDKTLSLLVGCSKSNGGGLIHKINFQVHTDRIVPAFPGSITLSQTTNLPCSVACLPTDIWLLGHWMGSFLPQALDWIQETGEYYLSTHTSTGETTEETQELLKEYGEFRVPAKVGSILEPSLNPRSTPHSGQVHTAEGRAASVRRNA